MSKTSWFIGFLREIKKIHKDRSSSIIKPFLRAYLNFLLPHYSSGKKRTAENDFELSIKLDALFLLY